MSIKFDVNDLKDTIQAGENEAKLIKVDQVEKEIKNVPKKVIKFYFQVEDETLVEECIRYVKGNSKLRNYIEGMTGKKLEDLFANGFSLSNLVDKQYRVLIEKNTSKKTGQVFNNVKKIGGQIKEADERG